MIILHVGLAVLEGWVDNRVTAETRLKGKSRQQSMPSYNLGHVNCVRKLVVVPTHIRQAIVETVGS